MLPYMEGMTQMPMRLLLLALLLLCGPRALLAAESAPVTTPRSTATLITDTDAIAPGQAFQAALRLRLAPGWHVYWRNPGDAGIAPELAFTLPAGAAAGDIMWPAPLRLPEGSLVTYGYTGDVVLPVTLTGAAGAVQLQANWLICQTLCVPEDATLTLDLPAGTAAPSAQAPLFAVNIPRPTPWPARFGPDGTLRVDGAGFTPASVASAWFAPLWPDQISNAAPQTLSLAADGLTLTLTPAAKFQPDTPLEGVLTLTDSRGQASALLVSAMPGPIGAPLAWWRVLGLAFLGGVILNLMPCVFPVLAIKAAGLARLAQGDRAEARAHAAWYTAGVVATFLLVAGVLLAARAAGMAAGWGFQFQTPVFVAAMAWLMLAVGLNLSGVYEVRLGLAGAGQDLAGRGGHVGSLFTGALAVLVATPCTTPFMVTAVAAALAAPPAWALAVFAALGFGLAAPYVLLACIPALARALPRPGRWMEVLRQALAFPLYGACVWLVWVASQQTGPQGVLLVGAGMVLVAFAAWAVGLAQAGGGFVQ